jgi:glycosyltransferase involved in cell wall biosynthesis
MPLVSVVIPTYNRANFVTKAIGSILNQTFSDYEIIVVDDGSTDDTQEALEHYMGKIKYVYQNNAGVSSARNVGVNESKGEWIAFLDSDDEWEKEYLDVQIYQIRNVPSAVCHITNSYAFSDNGKEADHFKDTGFSAIFGRNNSIIVEKPLRTLIKYHPWFVQSSIFHKRTMLSSGVFDISLSMAEDLDILARIAMMGPFTFTYKRCAHIIRRSEKIQNLSDNSRANLLRHHSSFCKVFEKLSKYPGLTLAEKMALSRGWSKQLRALGNVSVNLGKKSEARKYYWKSMICYPSFRSLAKYLATVLFGRTSRSFVRLRKF